MTTRLLFVFAVLLMIVSGCTSLRADPALATRPYPSELHNTDVVRVQVTRVDQMLRVLNATTTSYEDFDLWLNQRYVRRVERLAAGETIELRLDEFRDMFGQTLNSGGLWRVYRATPVRLVQIQRGEEQPLVGLITIRDDSGD